MRQKMIFINGNLSEVSCVVPIVPGTFFALAARTYEVGREGGAPLRDLPTSINSTFVRKNISMGERSEGR